MKSNVRFAGPFSPISSRKIKRTTKKTALLVTVLYCQLCKREIRYSQILQRNLIAASVLQAEIITADHCAYFALTLWLFNFYIKKRFSKLFCIQHNNILNEIFYSKPSSTWGNGKAEKDSFFVFLFNSKNFFPFKNRNINVTWLVQKFEVQTGICKKYSCVW